MQDNLHRVPRAESRVDATGNTALGTTALAAVGLVFVPAYWLTNRLAHTRADIGTAVFAWERAIPFVEWTIIPYLSIIGLFAASFFVGARRADYRAALACHVARLLCVLLLSLLCFALLPLRVTFERPPTSGFTGVLFDVLSAFDLPYNRAPSLHVSLLVILWARLSANVSRSLRRVLGAWFVLIGASVLTTYQHHVIDVPAGLLAGWVCVLSIRSLGAMPPRSAARSATVGDRRTPCRAPSSSPSASRASSRSA